MEWARKKKNAYFLGMGDYDDFCSGSERPIIYNPSLHESTKEEIQKWQDRMVAGFAKEIDFMRGRLIGLIEGNHYGMFDDGTTTTQRLAQKMGCRYLGVNSYIRLIVEHDRHHRHKLRIWAHHGLGAARLTGGSLSKVEQMVMNARADIYLMGHDHRKSIGMDTILEDSDGQNSFSLIARKIIFARTGSFLRGYVPNRQSYVAGKAMRPTDLGTIKIEVTPKIKKHREKGRMVEDRRYLDIHASI